MVGAVTTLERVRIDELIALARARRASDLHLGGESSPTLRVDGRVIVLDLPPVAQDALVACLSDVFPDAARRRLAQFGNADIAIRRGAAAPYRLHAYRTTTGLRLAFRFLSETVPSLDALALPAIITTFTSRPNGLVLFTGPTGSGKTTALAALIDRMNRTSERVIVTVEDPVEYVHAPVRSMIAHCEIGTDVSDYAEALRGFLRADPDVILVGEMRDRETMEAALTAAETGHLVLSTLHTNDAAQTVDRIVDSFPSEAHAQIRTQVAATLVAVVSLRLVPLRVGSGRIAVAEILIGTDAVRAIIRDGKTHQLRNTIATGRAAGMQTLESHLSDLAVHGMIDVGTARAAANRPNEINDLDRIAG
jgi:twitching motility protein PilT